MKNFKIPRVIERSYATAIDRLMQGLKRELSHVASPFFIADIMRRLARSPTFIRACDQIARSMATHLFRDGHKMWRAAAAEGSKGRIIRAALQRELASPRVAKVYEGIISRNSELIRSMPLTLADRVAHKVAKGYEQGLRPEALLDDILKEYPRMTEAHARLIARTETSKASTALTQVRAAEAGLEWYVWRTSEDARVRSAHAHMDGVIIPWNEAPAPEELNHEPSQGHYHAGNIYNCFPGSTIVNLSNGCHKLWRRKYKGLIVCLTLSDGTVLKATPNHPILTRRGWLPANDIKKGDNLFHLLCDSSNAIKKHEDAFKFSFKDTFKALSRFSGVSNTLCSKFDFHGDVTEADVDVIDTDSLLTSYIESVQFKSFVQFYFPRTDSDSCASFFRIASLFDETVDGILATHRLVSFANNFFTFLDAHFTHSHSVCSTTVSDRNIIGLQNSSDGSTTARVFFREGKLAFTSNISSDYIIAWQVCATRAFQIWGIDYTPSSESLLKCIGFDGKRSGNTLKASTISYQLLSVMDISFCEFVGHVYNLQSNCSWYSIAHNEIIVHNCRCYPEPLIRLDQVSWPAKVYRNGKIERMGIKQFRRLLPGGEL